MGYFMDIKSQIIEILSTDLGVDKASVKMESKIAEDLGADSLDTVELLQTLEDKLGVSIPDADLVNIKTVQDIVNYIESKKT